MKNHLADIIKSAIGSILVVLLVSFNPFKYLPLLSRYNYTIEFNVIGLLLSAIFLFGFFIYLFKKRRPLLIKNGRSDAMAANVQLLKRKEPKNRLKKYIYSTRVSFWPLSEYERARNEFRELLTKKIREGFLVKRIWQIHNSEDFKRLLIYLELYKDYDNYSVKCFIGKSAFIPEILSVFGKVVSVSIPQAEDPRRLTTAFHFRGKDEILRWEGYFEILWDQSISIKIGNNIYNENINKLKINLLNNMEAKSE